MPSYPAIINFIYLEPRIRNVSPKGPQSNWTILCLTCFLKGTSKKWDFINITAVYELALPFSLSQHNNILQCP